MPSPIECSESSLTFHPNLSAACSFPSQIFLDVMLNLIRNPNITATHLFRADILYDSESDRTYCPGLHSGKYINPSSRHHTVACKPDPAVQPISNFVTHMKAELRPRVVMFRGFALERTLVRELVPRNPQRDRPLVQTCHIYSSNCSDEVREGPKESHDDCRVEGSGGGGGCGGASCPGGDDAKTLVIYLPHADRASDMPFYHPKVKALAFLHQPSRHTTSTTPSGSANTDRQSPQAIPHPYNTSLHIAHFPPTPPSTHPTATSHPPPPLGNTPNRLLSTILKHGTGTLNGYTKHATHDVIIPQPRSQDTYTRLKLRYARGLLANWREQTDPGKHVFEDLGIAAFLIELWRDMYGAKPAVEAEVGTESGERAERARGMIPPDETSSVNADANANANANTNKKAQEAFPGFVDMACGNGLLVHVLASEGYSGWGFDARPRKSWDAYPSSTRARLRESVLVPEVFSCLRSPRSADDAACDDGCEADGQARAPPEGDCSKSGSRSSSETQVHDGVFPPGTFLISNHADELTPWTPLLAFLSGGGPRGRGTPFLCIPCCSHDLAGRRTRFPAPPPPPPPAGRDRREDRAHHSSSATGPRRRGDKKEDKGMPQLHAAETGSLVGPGRGQTQRSTSTSTYAGLCAYVEKLAREVGLDPLEREALRIPSTRNVSFLWRGDSGRGGGGGDDRPGDDGEEDGPGDDSDEEDRNKRRENDLETSELSHRKKTVQGLVARELGVDRGGGGGALELGEAARLWVERAGRVAAGKGGRGGGRGH